MKKSRKSFRVRFPEDEKRLEWLPMLLDAYAVVDRGIAEAIAKKEKSGKVRLACKRGCGDCCSFQSDIPVYPMEMAGMYWYTMEKMPEPFRTKVKEQLAAYRNEVRCPFLTEGVCAVHPMRPVACRLFNVFGLSCAEGGDPYHTRPGDVLRPPREITDRAFFIMLPFYGVTDDKAKEDMIRTGLIHSHARVLRSLPWKELAKRMAEAGSAAPE